jgi:hypothetical protein
VNGSIVGVNPLLGPLQNNGGPTLTHALLTGSPAINAGNNCVLTENGCGDGNLAMPTDQRGFGRVGVVDIGAFERQSLRSDTSRSNELCVGDEWRTVQSSSQYSNAFPATAIINGDRKGLNWGSGGGWNDNTAGVYPDFLQIDFSGTKTIDEVDVFTIQDNYASPVEPTVTDSFSQYGITSFEIQYWNGSGWVTVQGGSVSNNNKVWTKVSFDPVETSAVRVLVNGSLAGYSRIVEVEAWGSLAEPPSPEGSNVALSHNGGVASASSEYSSSFPITAINNGDRAGVNWGASGGWNDSSAGIYPDTAQVEFNGTKTIDEIDVFTIQDNFGSPSQPTEGMTFNQYGITAFDIQYWSGSDWLTVPGGSITANNKVWTKVTFTPVETTKIRVLVNNSLAGYSRIVEIEAWTVGGAPTPTRTNFALASNGGLTSAPTEYSSAFPVAAANNGDRKGLNWGSGGGWNDNTNGVYPDFLQIDFNGTKTIDEVDVFTIQDNFSSPSEPTLADIFGQYGVTSFDIQYWNGSAWVTVPGGSVTGNNKVWTQVSFSAITTDKIRVQVNNSLAGYSRLVEVEAFGSP